MGEAGAGCGRGRGAMAAAGEELPELSGGAWWSSRAAVCPPRLPAPRDGHGCQTRATAMAVEHVRRPRHGTAAGWTAGMTAAGTAMGMPEREIERGSMPERDERGRIE